LDRLDVAILRELTQAQLVLPGRPGVGPSTREVSRKLGLPPGTVRYRMKRMYTSGIIRGSSVFPNPNLLGVKAGAFTVDVSPLMRKAEVVDKLKQVEGVGFIHDFIGTLLWAVFMYDGEKDLQSKLAQMKEAVGSPGFCSSIPYPPCTVALTQPEAELVLRLLKRGFDSYPRLAKEMGVSVRTLQRRISKLVREGAVLSLPKVDYHAMSGSVPADLVVLFKDNEAARSSQSTILPIVGEYVILAALWDVIGMCSLVLPDVAAVTRIAESVRQVNGVSMARVEIVKDHIDQVVTLEGYLRRWMAGNGFEVAPLRAQQS
jgi:DNA-binding Lrp family transcriptional regulator